MSIYKLLRASAVTTLLVKYREKLFRVALAVAFALVTAWGYGDVAQFLESQHPDSLWLALVGKNLIIYAALFYGFWQFRPSATDDEGGDKKANTGKGAARAATPMESDPKSGPGEAPEFGKLDALGDVSEKPALKSRKQAILERNDIT